MVLQTTPRLGLTYDTAEGQPVGTQGPNWDRVDSAAGIMSETTAAPLSDAQKFEGAIVVNRDTGISYACQSNGSGGWIKHYINYPWEYCATGQSLLTPNNSWLQWGWNTFNAGNSFNASDADKIPGSDAVKVPVKGVYSLMSCARWANTPAGFTIRAQKLRINGVDQLSTEERLESNPNPGVPVANQLRVHRIFNAGDTILGEYFQNCGTTLRFDSVIFIALVRPIW